MLFEAGRNVAQVAAWLGHTDPAFTLRTYVHLLPEDLPEPDFRAGVGNARATQATEINRNGAPVAESESTDLQAEPSLAFGTSGP